MIRSNNLSCLREKCKKIDFSKNWLKFQNLAKDPKTFERCLSGRRRLPPVTTSSGSPATPSVEDLIDYILKRKYLIYFCEMQNIVAYVLLLKKMLLVDCKVKFEFIQYLFDLKLWKIIAWLLLCCLAVIDR
jgi:hypothetical protein